MGDLTKPQAAILKYMIQHLERYQSLPTVRGIGEKFGIGSTNGVMCHLRALEKKGHLVRRGHDVHSPYMLAGYQVQLVPVEEEAAVA